MKSLALFTALTVITACDIGQQTKDVTVWLPTTGAISLDAYALQRASNLTGIDAPAIWHDNFLVPPGDPSSMWRQVDGEGPAPIILSTGMGGVVRLDSGTGINGYSHTSVAGFSQLIGVVGDVGNGASFYSLFRFRVPTAVTAACAIRLGIARADNAASLVLGVRGASSTSFFRFSKASAGVLSTVAIDTEWHQGELWSDGANNACGSIDVEDPVCFSVSSFGASLGPWMIVANGAVSDPGDDIQVDVDDAVYVFPAAGN